MSAVSNQISISIQTSSVPAHIQSAPAGAWTRLTTNTIDSVQALAGAYADGLQSLSRMFEDWNGASYDPIYHRFTLYGGGHLPGGYPGNECYGFRLDTAQWERLNAPSPYPAPDWGAGSAYATEYSATFNGDGRPTPEHNYFAGNILRGSTHKIYRAIVPPTKNVLLEWTPPAPGATYENTWNGTAGGYRIAGDYSTTVATWAYATGAGGDYDSVDDALWYYGRGNNFGQARFIRIPFNGDNIGTPTQHIYSPTGTSDIGLYTWCCVDPVRRIVLGGGGRNNSSHAFSVYYIDAPGSSKAIQAVTGTPGSVNEGGHVFFDSYRNIFWGTNSAGQALYKLTPAVNWQTDAWAWATVSATGTPTAGNQGIYTKFRYCSDYDVILTCPTNGSQVWIYKPTDWRYS